MEEQEYSVVCKKCDNILYYMAFECIETLVDCPECGSEYLCCEHMIIEDVTK